ncbi:hypothetical protein O5D80_003025 [Batrachochytrium dendrobatidis]|nr:hypothetical protein O5D80_003025 [Batrachochytrium dendrobatidis]
MMLTDTCGCSSCMSLKDIVFTLPSKENQTTSSWTTVQQRVHNYYSTVSAIPTPMIPTDLVFESDSKLLLQAPILEESMPQYGSVSSSTTLYSDHARASVTSLASDTHSLYHGVSNQTRRPSTLCSVSLGHLSNEQKSYQASLSTATTASITTPCSQSNSCVLSDTCPLTPRDTVVTSPLSSIGDTCSSYGQTDNCTSNSRTNSVDINAFPKMTSHVQEATAWVPIESAVPCLAQRSPSSMAYTYSSNRTSYAMGPSSIHPKPHVLPCRTNSNSAVSFTSTSSQQHASLWTPFTLDGNLWATNSVCDNGARQLTFNTDPDISNGCSHHIYQDRLDRSIAYWEKPHSSLISHGDKKLFKHQILYIQFNKQQTRDSDAVDTRNSWLDPHSSDLFDSNSSEDLHLVEFDSDEQSPPTHYCLPSTHRIRLLFPWCKYIVRAGWLPDDAGIWAQLLDQSRKRTAIIRISESLFVEHSNVKKPVHDTIQLLLEEECVSGHITISDAFCFVPAFDARSGLKSKKQSPSDLVEFIWTSKRSGFNHLYLVTCTLSNTLAFNSDSESQPTADGLPTPNSPSILHALPVVSNVASKTRQITTGDWNVLHSQIWADAAHKLVYFMGTKDTLLERHLYVSSFHHDAILLVSSFLTTHDTQSDFSLMQSPTCFSRPSSRLTVAHIQHNIRRLTDLGKSHSVTMSNSCSRFVTVFSSILDPPQTMVFDIVYSENTIRSDADSSGISRKIPVLTLPPSPMHPQKIRHRKASGTCVQSNSSVASSPEMYYDLKHRHKFWNACVRKSLGTVPDKTQLIRTTLLLFADTSATASMDAYMELLDKHILPTTKFITQVLPPLSTTNGNESSESIRESSRRQSLVYERLPVPEIFSFVSSNGTKVHGMICKPLHYCDGMTYPTIVLIHDALSEQTVLNEFQYPKLQGVFMALKFGFALVIVDSVYIHDTGGCSVSFVGDHIEALLYLSVGCNQALFNKELDSAKAKPAEPVDPYDLFDLPEYAYGCSSSTSMTPSSFISSSQPALKSFDSATLSCIWDSVKMKKFCGEYSGLIDMDRVFVQGVGRGGHVAVLSICHFPTVFKLALAIAPRVMANVDGGMDGVAKHFRSMPDDPHHRVMIVDNHDESDLVRGIESSGKTCHVAPYAFDTHPMNSYTTIKNMDILSMCWFQSHF